jgi:DNA-binding protein HU-beta
VEEPVNRSELIAAVATATGLPRAQVEATLTATLTQVRGAVASGDKVQLLGFGTFESRERAARTARNPATGAQLELAATRVVGFKVGAPFKQEVADSTTTKAPATTAANKTPTKASAATDKSAATKSAATKSAAKKAPAK